jgi:hypothetical protein
MTERLATLLHEEADAIDVPAPPTVALLAGGRRLRRRRRAMVGAGAVAAVLAAGGGGLLARDAVQDRTSVIDPDVAAAEYASDGAFAVGRDLYLGEEHFRWDEPIKAIYYTSAGVVVRSGDTADTDASGPSNYELVTPTGERSEIDVRMGDRVAGFEPDSTRLAYAAPTDDPRRWDIVVHDVVTDRELARETVDGSFTWGGWEAPPVAIDGDLVWAHFDGEWVQVDWRTGETAPVPDSADTFEVANGRYAVERGHVWEVRSMGDGTTVGHVTLRKGWYAFFSPDARFMRSFPNGQESKDGITAITHEVASGSTRELPGVSSDLGWTPDGHLLVLDGDTVSICEATTDVCEERTYDLGSGDVKLGGNPYES